MNDLLFQYDTLAGKNWRERALQAAVDLGLKEGPFTACLDSLEARGAVARDVEAGAALGLTGTPSFTVHGRVYKGDLPPDAVAPPQ